MENFGKSFLKILKKGTAVLVCTAFLVTSVSLPQSRAGISPLPIASTRSLSADLTAIALPNEIGRIQETYRGTSDNVVVLIQDAHSIPDAQRNIRYLIDHFQTQYGVTRIGLEGASEKLDPTIFRSFPEKEKLRQVMDVYADHGELTGGTAAAIFSGLPDQESISRSPSSSNSQPVFRGIEDWPLYEEGVGYYLRALEKEPEIKAILDPLESELKKEKESVYSKEFLEIDRLLAEFGENKTDLVQVLNKLSEYQPPPQGSELAVLLEELQKDPRPETGDQSLEMEVKRIAEKVKLYLAKTDKGKVLNDKQVPAEEAFNQKYQEFQTSRITSQAFGLYLKELVKKWGIRVKVSKRLAALVENQRRLKDIEGTRLFEEFKRYTDSVIEKLIGDSPLEQRNSIRELQVKTTTLDLIKRLVRLELRFEDWEELKQTVDPRPETTDSTKKGTSSLKHLSGKALVEGSHSPEVKRVAPWFFDSTLRTKLESHIHFYEVAEQRDEVFYKNLISLMQKDSLRTALLVAGGFHTEGMKRIFKEKGISYVLVTPRINTVPDGSLYRAHMQGKVSWSEYFEVKEGKVNLYDAFVRGARDRLLGIMSGTVLNSSTNLDQNQGRVNRDRLINTSAVGRSHSPEVEKVRDPRVAKEWRDQIIRDLAAEGRITNAGDYTRFIDETTKPGGGGRMEDSDKLQAIRKQWLSNIDRFGEGLKKLQTEGNLSESSILQLIKTITIPAATGADALAAGCEIRADLLGLPEGSPSVVRHNIAPTTFEQYLSTPLLEHDKSIGDELRFIFQLFGHIDFRFVSPDTIMQKNSITQNIYDDSGQLKTILCSDKFTAENLIDILSVLRNLSPEGRWSWEPLAIRVYSYFKGWKDALNRYSMQSGTQETLRNELANLEAYFSKLAEKIKSTLGLSGKINTEAANVESSITHFIDRALARTESITLEMQQQWIERLELFFSSHLATYLTDQIDRVLIEHVFGQFKQLTENWDILSSRNEILVGIIGEDASEKFGSWLELARAQFQKLQDENRGNPEKLRQLHIQFAQEIGKVIKTQFPDYSSSKYQLGKVVEAKKANCVGYATMFYLIAKEIGLNVAYTSVEYTGDREIHHAANLLHLPSVNGEDSFVVVDVTWDNYISEPISSTSIRVQYEDGMLRRIAIPQTMSEHNVVVEYQDSLYGIQHAIYSWASSSNEYLTNPNLKKRVAERMLRINPNDAIALRLLGIYYASAEGESAHNINSAISYLQRSLKLKVDRFALHKLKRLSLKLGRIGDFYHFCEQLLSVHNSPNAYIVVAHTIERDDARENKGEILQKTLAVLEGGLKLFPENSDIMKELASVHMDLFTHLSETSEKRRAYDTAIDYMERTLKKTPADGKLLNKYWQLVIEEAGSERFVLFCSKMRQANPQLSQPVCALMHHYEMQNSEEGYNTAIRLAKEYLEKPESTDRRRVLWSLHAIYTNLIYETNRRGNIYYGKIDDLLQYLHELLNKYPDCFATVQFIAETNVRAKRYGEAIPYLQRFLQRFPHNKECLKTLITCQAAVKDWQGVVTTAEATFDADSDNETALKLAGIAYEESGRFGEAIIKFERFLALYGGYSDASDIKTRLAFCQERAREAMGELARTDSMTLMRSEDRARQADHQGVVVDHAMDGKIKPTPSDSGAVGQNNATPPGQTPPVEPPENLPGEVSSTATSDKNSPGATTRLSEINKRFAEAHGWRTGYPAEIHYDIESRLEALVNEMERLKETQALNGSEERRLEMLLRIIRSDLEDLKTTREFFAEVNSESLVSSIMKLITSGGGYYPSWIINELITTHLQDGKMLVACMAAFAIKHQYRFANMLWERIRERLGDKPMFEIGQSLKNEVIRLNRTLDAEGLRPALALNTWLGDKAFGKRTQRFNRAQEIIRQKGILDSWEKASDLAEALVLFQDLTVEDQMALATLFYKDHYGIDILVIDSQVEIIPLDGEDKPVKVINMTTEGKEVIENLKQWSFKLSRFPLMFFLLHPHFDEILIAGDGRAYDNPLRSTMLLTVGDRVGHTLMHEFGHVVDPYNTAMSGEGLLFFNGLDFNAIKDLAQNGGYELSGNFGDDIHSNVKILNDLIDQMFRRRQMAWRILNRNFNYYTSGTGGVWERFLRAVRSDRGKIKEACKQIHSMYGEKIEAKVDAAYEEVIQAVEEGLKDRTYKEGEMGDTERVQLRRLIRKLQMPLEPLVGNIDSDRRLADVYAFVIPPVDVERKAEKEGFEDENFRGVLRKGHEEFFAERFRLFFNAKSALLVADPESHALFKILFADSIARSEQRVTDEASLKEVVNALRPGADATTSSGLVDGQTVRQVEVMVVRGDRDALIAALKQAAEEQMVVELAKGTMPETPAGVSAKEMVEKIRGHQKQLFDLLQTLPGKGVISVGFMMDQKDSQSFLSQFVKALQRVPELTVEVIASPQLLNDPALKEDKIVGLVQKRPVRGMIFRQGNMETAGANSEVPLATDPAAKNEIGALAAMFRALLMNFDGIDANDTLMRDHIELVCAVALLKMAQLATTKQYKDLTTAEAKAEYLKTQLEKEDALTGMFRADPKDGSLSLVGAVVQDYVAHIETQKAA